MPARSHVLRIGRLAGLLLLAASAGAAQTPFTAQTALPTEGPEATRRLDERIRALQTEAEQLAGAARTLIRELRALEVERNLRRAEAARAEETVTQARQALADTTARLEALEQERLERLPALRSQLVDLYKHGTLAYARILTGVENLREFGRASRLVTTMADMSRRRLEAHRLREEAVSAERATQETHTRTLEARETEARQARAAAERAVAAHAARVAEIDSRRDLNAQYLGELQASREALTQQLAAAAAEAARAAAAAPPIEPLQGSLAWPVEGVQTSRFGQTTNRLGGSAVRNGIEIVADEGTPVRAVHAGTVVHAGPFDGFGTLVILDHGSENYSLYGYLGATALMAGQAMESGGEIGQVGASPAGPAALYFEMQIDGRPVDPVQWLEPR